MATRYPPHTLIVFEKRSRDHRAKSKSPMDKTWHDSQLKPNDEIAGKKSESPL
jgi:hypothetical protein